jgi:hypothetical protein
VNWIKVAVDIKADDAMGVIVDDCDVPRYAAVGLCVNVLGTMATKAQDGDLSAVRDSTIEEWAGWDGKRGRFAVAFRAAMCKDGIVRSWEKYNGAAIRKAEADIERIRAKRRGEVEGCSRDVRANIARTSPDVRANIERTTPDVRQVSQVDEDVDGNSLTNTDDDVIPSPSSSGLRDVLPMVAQTGHMALTKLFANVSEPAVWAGIVRGMASGLSMDGNRPVGPERLAAAVEDFVAQGHHTNPNPSLFRGFVKRAKTPDRGRFALQQTPDEQDADLLRTIREQNTRARMRGDPEKPIPTWADRIDATFPDGRTWPSGAAA